MHPPSAASGAVGGICSCKSPCINHYPASTMKDCECSSSIMMFPRQCPAATVTVTFESTSENYQVA